MTIDYLAILYNLYITSYVKEIIKYNIKVLRLDNLFFYLMNHVVLYIDISDEYFIVQ